MSEAEDSHASVREYYGKVLQGSQDLQTNACCTGAAIPKDHKAILAQIDDEIIAKFYGCGSPIPSALEGCTVLDLGCGTGRDAYLASALVGASGRVIGLDMTEEQLAVARKHIDSQTKRFGFCCPNVSFVQGYIEDLAAAGIEDNSVDVVISNCVINLSPDKERVFREIFRVLKPGGELYFSDVFCDRRLPVSLREDPELLGECIAGALYIEDFRRLLGDLGCPDFRLVDASPITIDNPVLEARVGNARFQSFTIRAFKLAELEDRCEDYGQGACYRGGISESPGVFRLDQNFSLEKDRPIPVCGNTAAMLASTRFSPYFQISGDRSQHFGIFNCTTAAECVDSSCCC